MCRGTVEEILKPALQDRPHQQARYPAQEYRAVSFSVFDRARECKAGIGQGWGCPDIFGLLDFAGFVALRRRPGIWDHPDTGLTHGRHCGSQRTATRDDYKSRPGALIWFFRKSRDRWKSKHQDLKASVKGVKNRVAAVTKSREQWRAKAEQAGEQLAALEAENALLRAQIAALEEKKKRPREGAR